MEKWRKVVEPREVPSANCDLCRNEKKMLSRNRIRLKSSFNFGITKSGVGLIKLNMRKLTS